MQLDADMCRRLNEQADGAAKRHCAARCMGADRQRWHAEFERARALEETVVRFSPLAGRKLEAHLSCTALRCSDQKGLAKASPVRTE